MLKAAPYVPMPANWWWDTAQVAKFARVSLRQLQWWDEQNLVSPRHDGHRRMYSHADTRRVLLIAELRRKGLGLNRMRSLLKPEILKQLGESEGDHFLVGNSKKMSLIQSRGEVIDLLKQARVPLFVLSVPDLLKPLHDAMTPPPTNGDRGKKK